jgi:hypothetical protein
VSKRGFAPLSLSPLPLAKGKGTKGIGLLKELKSEVGGKMLMWALILPDGG